jgi:hypothetical protein
MYHHDCLEIEFGRKGRPGFFLLRRSHNKVAGVEEGELG